MRVYAAIVLVLCGIACSVGAAELKKFAADDAYMVGVNLAGAEFAPGALPGVENRNYGWPSAECLDYWRDRGILLIRLPFLWKRLQPTLMGDFDPGYVAGLDRTMRLLEERGMAVVLDLHNYQMRMGRPIGGPDVPLTAYADLMKRLAARYKDSPSLWGYGLMNEPNGKGCPWAECAQAGIDAIREVDAQTQILVANDYPGWQCTQVAKTMQTDDEVAEWAESHMPITSPDVLRDPANNLRFELHCYFDHDASGTYRKSYESESRRTDDRYCPRVGPTIARDRLRPFVVWLKKHNARGFIGEYSAPAGPGVDERWLAILDDALAYMQENNLPSTFWAAGRHWSIKPEGNPPIIGPNGWPREWSAEQKMQDRPQLAVLRKHARPLAQ